MHRPRSRTPGGNRPQVGPNSANGHLRGLTRFGVTRHQELATEPWAPLQDLDRGQSRARVRAPPDQPRAGDPQAAATHRGLLLAPRDRLSTRRRSSAVSKARMPSPNHSSTALPAARWPSCTTGGCQADAATSTTWRSRPPVFTSPIPRTSKDWHALTTPCQPRLLVDGRDRTSLIERLDRQINAFASRWTSPATARSQFTESCASPR